MQRITHIRLAELPLHGCGVVTDVQGDDDEMARLQAMGVCRGHTVELVQRGDPLIIRAIGTRIGVSARLARKIYVNPDTKYGCPIHPSTGEAASSP